MFKNPFSAGDLYVQLYSRSPLPNKDYYGLTITSEYVILNSWDIRNGTYVYPRKFRTPLVELLEDEKLQTDIKKLFGQHVLHFSLQLAKNEKQLYTLPNKVFLKIVRLLAANDILKLGQTSKIFFELCNANPVWKILYRKRMKQTVTKQELCQAEKQSWRYLLKKKLTEKLALISNEKISICLPKPNKKVLDSIERYSKPYVHKIRQQSPEDVPNLDKSESLILLGSENNRQIKPRSVLTLNSNKIEHQKQTSASPKKERSFVKKPSLVSTNSSKCNLAKEKDSFLTHLAAPNLKEGNELPKKNSNSQSRIKSSSLLKRENTKTKSEMNLNIKNEPLRSALNKEISKKSSQKLSKM